MRWDNKKVSLTGSGYFGKGLGTTLMFLGASCTTGTCGSNGSDDLRSSYGYIAQLNYATTKDKESGAKKNSSFAPAVGMMLFF